MMRPEDLANEAKQTASRFDAQMSVLCGEELLQHNYPLIHAVGRASTHPPCLIDLRWGDTRCAEADDHRQGSLLRCRRPQHQNAG